MFLAIEGFGDFLADDNARVHGPVGKILHDLTVIVERLAAHAIVPVVRRHGGEAQVDGVCEVHVLDAPAQPAVARAQKAASPGVGGREPDFHGEVGPVRGGHEDGHAAHVDGDDLGALAARGVGLREGEVRAGGDGGSVLHGGVGVEGAHGGGEIGAFRVEGGTVLGDRRCGGGQSGAEGERPGSPGGEQLHGFHDSGQGWLGEVCRWKIQMLEQVLESTQEPT